MTQNSQYLQAFGDKDHNFSLDSTNATDGYHKVAHFTNQPSNPPAHAAGFAELYGFGGQLWFQTDSGFGPLIGPSVIGTNGSILIGGVRITWGRATGSFTGATPVAFSTAFSGPPYAITANLFQPTAQEFINVTNPLAASWTPKLFTREGGTGGGPFTLMYIAVGPG